MLIWIRNALYACILTALAPFLIIRSLRRSRTPATEDGSPRAVRSSWPDKLLGLSSPVADSGAPCIWLHGVSVGEVQLLRPVAEQLMQRNPRAKIFVSTTTRTGMQVARSAYPAAIELFYFPMDFSWAVRRTVRSIKPDVLVLGELEIWPNLLAICRQQNVAVMVANGRLSDKSFRGYQKFACLLRPVFSGLTRVCAQTGEYAQRFIACGTPELNVSVSGSVKFDNVNFDRRESRAESFRKLLGIESSERILVAGSTQVEEETAVLHAFAALQGDFPGLRLIIVPRHPERFAAAAAAVADSGFTWLQRSDLVDGSVNDQWQVLLVDSLGELSSWWALAEIALVGGTFGSRGGQNMIEPAAYGSNVVFGPRTENFRDVVQLLLHSDAAVQLKEEAELLRWLREQLTAPEQGRLRGERAAEIVRQQQGAMTRTLEAIEDLIT